MSTVTVSPKFQVVIPRDVREALKLEPGTRLQVFPHDGRIEMVPVSPIKALRGFARGMDRHLEREEDHP